MATEIYARRTAAASSSAVTEINPFPVELIDSRVINTSDIVEIGPLKIPGIGAASAYASGDTFGGYFEIPGVARVPGGTFVITTVMFYDLDNEGIGKSLYLFRTIPTLAADNAAWALTDAQVMTLMPGSPIGINIGTSHTNNYTFTASVAVYGKCAPGTTSIYGALQTSGADNIAAGAEPYIKLLVARD